MLIYFCAFLIFSAFLSCPASAFSTQFMIEEAGEVKKPEAVKETKIPKTEENKTTDQFLTNHETIAFKVIPVMTEVFNKVEDLENLTPLKLVTAIAAQHLMTYVQNIPVAGDTPADTLNMLEGIVQEINKTAQIMKLTAEYINISGKYILSNLNQYIKSSCEQNSLADTMKFVRKSFLKTINTHILKAVQDVNNKSKQRDITGSDILISSAYHIVTAFQQMTNEVITLTEENNKKCSKPVPNVALTSFSDETNATENILDQTLTIEFIPEQGKPHKSIKKDQATPTTEKKVLGNNMMKNLHDQLTLENLNDNQDLTVEIFSPEIFLHSKDKMTEENKKPSRPNTLNLPENKNVKFSYFPMLQKDEKTKKKDLNELTIEEVEKSEPVLKSKSVQTHNADSSFIDSLSNIPQSSLDSKSTNRKISVSKYNEQNHDSMMNILQLLAPGYQRPLKYQMKPLQCDEHVEPVCGIDQMNKKFIVFLNDCKREAHNKLHGTNYVWSNMEKCVGFFLPNPELVNHLASNNHQNIVDLRPR